MRVARNSLCIVMPVLNEGACLAPALLALQPLRQRGVQLVVVDGGSTDSTWAIAQRYADKVVLAARGRASQMNAGAAVATQDSLLFLHADTQLPASADHLILHALRQGRAWGRFDVRIDGPSPLLRVVERMMNWRSRFTGIATGDQAMFMRCSTFKEVGGFPLQPLMEDVELSTRLKRLSAPACLTDPVITSGRRWQKHGVLRTIGLMWRLRLAYFAGADPARLAQQYGYDTAPQPATAPMAIAIVAKAPVAGFAKTRLIPLLGATGAARAQRRFINNTVAAALAASPASVTLWCAPDSGHRFFKAMHKARSISLLRQPAGDLGERMALAFSTHFVNSSAPPLLLMGTDCPMLSPAHLQAAAQALQSHDVVIIPALDGGYVLIGMRRFVPEAFHHVTWSTPEVLAQTRAQLRVANASWHELPTLWDVDEPADWQRLQSLYGLPV